MQLALNTFLARRRRADMSDGFSNATPVPLMMVLFWTLIFSLLMVGLQGTAFAQNPKIGYVNAVKLIESAPQGEMARQQLEAEFSPREKELRQLRDKIRALEDKLEKDSLVMQESELRERENEIRDLQRAHKRTRREMQEDLNLRRNEALTDLQRIVTKAIVEIAKAENYDLILQDLVYASPKLDITEKVLEKLRSSANN